MFLMIVGPEKIKDPIDENPGWVNTLMHIYELTHQKLEAFLRKEFFGTNMETFLMDGCEFMWISN